MKKNLKLIHLTRYFGLALLPMGVLLVIFLHLGIGVGVTLSFVGLTLMGFANVKDFGSPTTVDILGIPAKGLREKDTEYESDGFIVTKIRKTKKIAGKDFV